MMENKEFYLEQDGCKIHCKLDYPEAMGSLEDKCPLLVLEHGFTGHMEERHIVGIAEYVRSLGFAVLRVNCTDTERVMENLKIIRFLNG